MTIVKIVRALVRLCGIVTCVTLAGLFVARADLGGREIVDNATYPTTKTKGNERLAKGGVIHLLQSPEHDGEYGAKHEQNKQGRCRVSPHISADTITRRQQCD